METRERPKICNWMVYEERAGGVVCEVRRSPHRGFVKRVCDPATATTQKFPVTDIDEEEGTRLIEIARELHKAKK